MTPKMTLSTKETDIARNRNNSNEYQATQRKMMLGMSSADGQQD